MDRLGRRIIQLQGFLMMGLTFGCLGTFLTQLEVRRGHSTPNVQHAAMQTRTCHLHAER